MLTTNTRTSSLLALSVAAFACGDDGASTEVEPEPTEPVVEYLSPEKHLTRASMALRGTRPSIADLEAVRDDPSRLPELVDDYLDTAEFGETMRDLHNDSLWSRVEFFFYSPVGFLSEGYSVAEINRSVSEAPLRLIEHVIMNNKPYTEIVTADYVVADEIVAGIWGIPYNDTADTWQVSEWADGRPEAGILSSSHLFVRHMSAGTNYNRGRANMVSRALLCFDFLERDAVIDTSVNLADPEAVTSAVTTVPQCVGCHQTLDPLASYFWGYEPLLVPDQITSYPVQTYKVDREDVWQDTTRRAPGFFGDQGGDLADLGDKIAADPRFAQCAARRFYAYLSQTDPAEVPYELISELQHEFVSSGYDAKALARAIVLGDEFRAAYSDDADVAEALVGFKKTRPEQLARMFEDLTGFRWEVAADFTDIGGVPYGTVDLARSDLLGFRTLAGGIDSYFVTRPAQTVNVTSSLVLQEFAAQAAGFVVEADFANRNSPRLLTLVGPDDEAEEDIRAQLVQLHLRIFAEAVESDSAEVDESYGLFAAVLDREGSAAHAWKVVLTAMFQDLEVAYY